MTRVRALLALMTVLLAAGAASAGELCSALDGATLQCGRERVRVEGLRAPALDEPGGQEARRRLEHRVRSGELVLQRKARDRFGRTLARAFVNGKRVTQLDLDPPRGRHPGPR